MKLCKDCKYIEESYWDECLHPKNLETDYSTGRLKRKWSPRSQRSSGWLETRLLNWCGREARWFEPREETA
jgi:hypothetical protein